MRAGKTIWVLAVTLLAVGLAWPGAALGVSMMPDEQGPVVEDGTGYLPSTEPALSSHATDAEEQAPLRTGSLPEAYDSRNVNGASFITPAKDQDRFNTCWAFSAGASLEASTLHQALVAGATSADLDFSERHLAYFTYNTQADPLGGTRGDATSPVGDSTYLSRGGNDLIATYALASWQGMADEYLYGAGDETATYDYLVEHYSDSNPAATDLDASLARQDVVHLHSSLRIPGRDIEDVKRVVMDYGAVSVGICSKSTYRVAASYQGVRCYAHYCNNASVSADHAVTIVGWDDRFPATSFKAGAQPSGDGAWLVKNSWGDSWGTDGYFWISYEDKVLTKDSANATAYEAEPANLRDNNYQYDGSSSMFYNYVRDGGSIANVYTARGNTDGTEDLTAVALSLTSTDVTYSVQVYTDIAWVDDPTSGTPQLARPQEGSLTYAGYHTIELDEPVRLEEGQTFSVVVTLGLANPGEGLGNAGDLVGYDVDRTHHASLYYRFDNEVEAGQSFERDYEGSSWDDLSATTMSAPDDDCDSGDEVVCTARLKAFTVNVGGTGEPDPDLQPTNPPQVRPTPDPDPDPDPDPTPVDETVPVWRMYNTKTSEHLYTRNKAEYDACGSGSYADWRAEGVAWYAPAAGTEGSMPVWRLYNTVSGDHHYTVSTGERDALVAMGDWQAEGTAFWSGGDVPIWRVYNGRLKRGQHHYTTRAGERDALIEGHGWSDEGVGLFCVSR